MKACVVGAGPSGLYAAKYLLEKGVTVNIFEKDNDILGNYKYAITKINPFTDMLKNSNLNVYLKTDASQIDDKNCDFYIMATGGIPRSLDIKNSNLCISAMDIIKNYHKNQLNYVGDKICIIGMGNVSLDLAKYLWNKCKELTILSRSNIENASFDNHVMREILDSNKWNPITNATVNDFIKKDQKYKRRRTLFEKFIDKGKNIYEIVKGNGNRTLNLLFGVNLKNIDKDGNKIKLDFSINDQNISELYDAVVSSIGFVPAQPEIKTNKPIYKIGWCNKAIGNINDSRIEAENCVNDISNSLLKN